VSGTVITLRLRVRIPVGALMFFKARPVKVDTLRWTDLPCKSLLYLSPYDAGNPTIRGFATMR
jgi:hypothetical protein